MGTRYWVSVILLSMVIPTAAVAGTGAGAIVYSFNTSARFEGMGGAGVGAAWGGATNQWANPAQLAYRQGFHCEWSKYQMAEGLADDIVLKNNELILGYRGIALTWGLWPASGRFFDLGEQRYTDENGQLLGTFSAYLKSSSFGLAVDAVQVVDLIGSRPPGEGLSRYFSLSFGYIFKDYEDMLSSPEILQDPSGGGIGTAKTHDLGFVARVTPLNTLNTDGTLGFLAGAAYGASTLNGGDEFIDHPDADQSDPLPRAHLDGWSVHGEIAFGQQMWKQTFSGFMAGLYETINPILSLTYSTQENVPGYIWSQTEERYVYQKNYSQQESGDGWEVGLANIFFLRRGHYKIPYLDLDDDTSGWGLNLQMKNMFGARYDMAKVPRPWNRSDAERNTWSFWVDPLAIWGDS